MATTTTSTSSTTTSTSTSSSTSTSTSSSSSTTTTTTVLPLVTGTDFTAGPLKDLGRIDILRETATKVIANVGSAETVTYSGGYIKGVFLKKSNQYKWEKAGLTAEADAYVLVAPTETIAKDDKITVDAESYIVDKVIIRKFRNTAMFKSCSLFKYDSGVEGT